MFHDNIFTAEQVEKAKLIYKNRVNTYMDVHKKNALSHMQYPHTNTGNLHLDLLKKERPYALLKKRKMNGGSPSAALD